MNFDFHVKQDKETNQWAAYHDPKCLHLTPICENSEGGYSGWRELKDLLAELSSFMEDNLEDPDDTQVEMNVRFLWPMS